jgi:hypothetical protein
MAAPIRKHEESDLSEGKCAPKSSPSKIKGIFKKAGRTMVYAQMLYKTASVPEKIALQCGIHAAFFIPLNNLMGCYLLYDDYKAYKERKNERPEILPFICTQYFNDHALTPLPCRHVVILSDEDIRAAQIDYRPIINGDSAVAPPQNSPRPEK